MLNHLDRKQRFMQKHKRMETNEKITTGRAIRSIKDRHDFEHLKTDRKSLQEAIEEEFTRLDLPKSWGKARVLWLKEIVLNATYRPEEEEEWFQY